MSDPTPTAPPALPPSAPQSQGNGWLLFAAIVSGSLACFFLAWAVIDTFMAMNWVGAQERAAASSYAYSKDPSPKIPPYVATLGLEIGLSWVVDHLATAAGLAFVAGASLKLRIWRPQ